MPQLWSKEGARASPWKNLPRTSALVLTSRVKEKASSSSELDVVCVHLLQIGVAWFTVARNLPFGVHDDQFLIGSLCLSGQ